MDSLLRIVFHKLRLATLLTFAGSFSSCSLQYNVGGDGMPIEGIQHGSKTYEYEITTTDHIVGVGFMEENSKRTTEVIDKYSGDLVTGFQSTDSIDGANRVLRSDGFEAKFENLSSGEGATTGPINFAVELDRDGIKIEENYLDGNPLPPGVGLNTFSCTGKESLSYFAGGEGTEQSPYLICSLNQLLSLHVFFENRNFKLMANIDMNNSALLPNGWQPVGTQAIPFNGTFDGGNRTLSNLHVQQGGSNVGLFGVAKDSTIKNLKITNADVRGQYVVGILLGKAIDSVKLENISTSGYAKASNRTLGGVLGSVSESQGRQWLCSFQLSNVTSSATLEIESHQVGGLVGYASCNTLETKVLRSSFSGSISGLDINASAEAGGLIGYMLGGSIERSFSTATMNVAKTSGGLVGKLFGGNIKNSYFNGSINTNDSRASGLVANIRNTVNIYNSYSAGTLTSASSFTAGLIAYGNTGARANIYNSFSVASQNGGGGEAGLLHSSIPTKNISDSQWLESSAGGATECINGNSSVGGCSASLSESDFHDKYSAPAVTQSLFSTWDFEADPTDGTEEIWIDNGTDLPTLKE